MDNLIELKALAEDSACAAGAVLRAGAAHLRMVRFQDKADIKLQADVESEQLIRERLKITGLPVYGEEGGGDATLTKRYELYWMVDPLDGTFNYSRGNPATCVSIGLMRGETPVLGVIYDFSTGECFSGIVTDGLYINGSRFQPLWASSRDQAALTTGFPSGMDKSPESLQAFVERIAKFKKVRMIGSAALALAYVAAGRFDVYYEEGIRLWDVAAGLALVQAAGGVISLRQSLGGKPLAYDVCAAAEKHFMV